MTWWSFAIPPTYLSGNLLETYIKVRFLNLNFIFNYCYYFFLERCLLLPAEVWTARGGKKVDIFVLLPD